jgi:hypothetical protein
MTRVSRVKAFCLVRTRRLGWVCWVRVPRLSGLAGLSSDKAKTSPRASFSLIPKPIHGIFQILTREKHDRHHCGSGEATLTQGGLCDVFRLLDGGVGLAADNGSHPWMCRVEGYRHAGLAYVQAVNHRQAIVVDRNLPVLAKMEECIVEHTWEPYAILDRGTKSPIFGEEEVAVVIHVHLKPQQ